jgi:hypothetical protein
LNGNPISQWQRLQVVLLCGVKNEMSVQLGLEQTGARQRVMALRAELLHLHKALLESERTGYEKVFGKIGSPYQFLQLATTDPWFAWLRPVTQLIVAMDELLEAKEPITAAAVVALVDQVRTLLIPAVDGEGFSRHYDEALQRDPDVVFAHAATVRLFRAGSGKGF